MVDVAYGSPLNDLPKCPECGAYLYVREDPYEGEVLYCRYCGWKSPEPEEEYEDPGEDEDLSG